jgi:membrane protein
MKTRQWWVAFGQLLKQRIKNQQLTQVASSLTFTTVLSLVPLVTVALAIFTAFPMFDRVQVALQAYLLDSFFPENIASTILKYVNLFSSKAKGLTLVGIVFLILTAFSTMLTVDRVFNRIWHVARHRSLAENVLLYWAVISFSPLAIGLSLTLSTTMIGHNLRGIDSSQGGFLPVLECLSFLITLAAFAFSYRIIPNRFVHWKDALAGGFVASVLFEVLKRAFSAYITHFPSYTALYGVLAAFPILLLWLYVSWLIVLLGACCAAVLPAVRSGHSNCKEYGGLRWVVGLAVLSRLEWARQQQRGGQTMTELNQSIPVQPDILDEILSVLVERELVGMLTAGKSSDLFVLICDPQRVKMDHVAKALWFDFSELSNWSHFFPAGAEQLSAIRREFLEKPSLSDWLSPSNRVARMT